jgi:hypothetical protein
MNEIWKDIPGYEGYYKIRRAFKRKWCVIKGKREANKYGVSYYTIKDIVVKNTWRHI